MARDRFGYPGQTSHLYSLPGRPGISSTSSTPSMGVSSPPLGMPSHRPCLPFYGKKYSWWWWMHIQNDLRWKWLHQCLPTTPLPSHGQCLPRMVCHNSSCWTMGQRLRVVNFKIPQEQWNSACSVGPHHPASNWLAECTNTFRHSRPP